MSYKTNSFVCLMHILVNSHCNLKQSCFLKMFPKAKYVVLLSKSNQSCFTNLSEPKQIVLLPRPNKTTIEN